jgi:ATP-dependent RNA helicase RhlE
MSTKHGANRLAEQLGKDGINAAAIHGNKSQGARTKALADFKNGSVRVLVATDIAARGLDIDQLPHVVNFELPNVPEDYVHRIGRTGRAGKEGEALSLVCVDERDYLRDIERLLKREIPKVAVAGFEPDPNARPEPIRQGRGQRGGGGRPQAPRQGGEQRRGGAPRHGNGQDRGNERRRDADQRHGGSGRRGGDHPRGPRPHSHALPRPQVHVAGGYHGSHETHRPDVDGNRRVDVEVDGNRRIPEGPSGHGRVRSSHSTSDQHSRRSRPKPAKGSIRRSW